MPGAQKCGHGQGNEVGVDRHNQSYKVDKFGEYEYITRWRRECEWGFELSVE